MRVWRGIPFVVAFAVSAYSFFTPGPDLTHAVTIWDKLGHALTFAALALTGRYAGWRARALGLGLFGYAVLTEILQAVLPIQRDGDWHDVLADSIGIGCGLLVSTLVVLAVRRLRPRWDGSTSTGPRHAPG